MLAGDMLRSWIYFNVTIHNYPKYDNPKLLHSGETESIPGHVRFQDFRHMQLCELRQIFTLSSSDGEI